jgi:hypothetical protein
MTATTTGTGAGTPDIRVEIAHVHAEQTPRPPPQCPRARPGTLRAGHAWESEDANGRLHRGHRGPGFGKWLVIGRGEYDDGTFHESGIDIAPEIATGPALSVCRLVSPAHTDCKHRIVRSTTSSALSSDATAREPM